MSSTASPFVSALPSTAQMFLYDQHGDAIMTDAVTGLPITYGAQRMRSHSEDSGTGTLVASPVAAAPAHFAVCPPAPPRPARAVLNPEDEDDSVVRNLAETMAEAVLLGEPRDEEAPAPSAPPAGEPEGEEDQGWCVSVTVSDLALRLDMRHPRVLLNLLRFVDTYNELAPPGEEIHMPLMPQERAEEVLSHESIVNPAPEFAAEVAELRALIERYSEPEPVYEDDDYSTDPEDRRDYYRRDSF